MLSLVHNTIVKIKQKVIELRQKGKTYGEIQSDLGITIPKGTLSYWCKKIVLPPEYKERVSRLMAEGLNKSRASALARKQQIREENQELLIKKHQHIGKVFENKQVALVALAMLCLGEGSKNSDLYLGNSDPRIIKLFISLLKKCFVFDIEKVRCTVQCRADQNIQELENYWSRVSGIPKRLFYKTRVDPRTLGKKTTRSGYMGVLRVDYMNREVQKTLMVLYNLLAESI